MRVYKGSMVKNFHNEPPTAKLVRRVVKQEPIVTKESKSKTNSREELP